MDGYISKPIKIDELVEQLDGILTRVRAGEHKSSTPSREIFDRNALGGKIQGDGRFLARIVEMFKEDYPKLLREIEFAVSDRNSDLLVEKSHTLKGVVKNFHAAPAEKAVEEMHSVGVRSDFGLADVAFEELRLEMTLLVKALEEYLGECES
jgi:hypothetical protein